MTTRIRKISKVVDIFNKRILDSCKFISDSASKYGLVYSYLFPCSPQSLNQYHSAWRTTYQDSTLYVFIFLLILARGGGEIERETPSLHYYFLLFCLFLIFVKKQSQELTRVNPDRNIFSINVELTSTVLLYRGLVHHHH